MRIVKVEGGFVARPVERVGARDCMHRLNVRHHPSGGCIVCFARATLALKQLSDLGQRIATDALTALKVKQ